VDQPENADQDKIDSDNIIQEVRSDENQDSGNDSRYSRQIYVNEHTSSWLLSGWLVSSRTYSVNRAFLRALFICPSRQPSSWLKVSSPVSPS
jgi:hypothetical protein